MAAVERSSLPDQVFRELVAAVVGGRYAPGDRLPPQRALAADLGVNMASLREGIKRLEQLRLVDVKHGDAMRVPRLACARRARRARVRRRRSTRR